MAQWPCAQRSFILRYVLPRHYFNYLVVFNFLTDLAHILETMGLTAWKKANSLSARYKIIEEPRLEGTLWEPFCGKGSLDEIICHRLTASHKPQVMGTLPCVWGGGETRRAIQFPQL